MPEFVEARRDALEDVDAVLAYRITTLPPGDEVRNWLVQERGAVRAALAQYPPDDPRPLRPVDDPDDLPPPTPIR